MCSARMLKSCRKVNKQLWKGCYSPRILKSSAVSEYATVANGAEQSNTSKAPRARNVYRMPAETRFTDAYQEYFNSMPAQSTSKYTQHPGAALNKPIKPPPKMMQAAVKLLQQYPIPNREVDVKKLKNYLSERRIPTENSDLNSLAQKIEKDITRKKLEKTETRDLTQEELEEYMADVKRQTKKKLRNQVYHWKPIEMDAFTSLVYMSSNLLSNYATLYSIMNEIAKIDAQFQPESMLDFGSGLATSVWAANAIWKESISEHYCWDKSGDICTLARLLLQEAEEYDDMIYPGVYFRQQLERRDSNQQAGFDLVICSHSLFELPNKQTRLQYIDKLWDQTEGYLIITDIGTPRGHQIVEEARMHLIEKNNDSEENRASVFSPCPHDSPCPRLKQKLSCSFQASYATGVYNKSKLLYEAPPVQAERKKKTIKGTSTRFSYVVLKKGEFPDTERLPRLIDRVTENTPSCMQCNICYPDGKVRLTNVTRRESIIPFRLVKNSAWGSRLPLVDWDSIAEQHQSSNDTDTSDLDLKHLSENSEHDDVDTHNDTNIDNENTDSPIEEYEAELCDGGDNLKSRESFKLPTSEKCDCGNDEGLCDNKT